MEIQDREQLCQEIGKLNEVLKEKLRENEKKVNLLFDNIIVGIIIINPEGIIMNANSASERFIGYLKEEIIGKHYSVFIYEKDIPKHVEEYEALLRNEKDSFILEQRYVKKTKEIAWGRIGVTAIRDREGKLESGICVCDDITLRKTAEIALVESKFELDSIIKFIPDIVFRANESGIILFISNSIKRYGYDEKELLGTSIFELICSAYRDKLAALAKEKFTDSEFCFLTKENDRIPILVSTEIIQDHENRSVVLIQGIAKDITDIARRKEERETLIWKLEAALGQVKLLSGFLRICASCKRIRDDKGVWRQIEEYIAERSEAEFTHGICPECAKRLYPEFNYPE